MSGPREEGEATDKTHISKESLSIWDLSFFNRIVNDHPFSFIYARHFCLVSDELPTFFAKIFLPSLSLAKSMSTLWDKNANCVYLQSNFKYTLTQSDQNQPVNLVILNLKNPTKSKHRIKKLVYRLDRLNGFKPHTKSGHPGNHYYFLFHRVWPGSDYGETWSSSLEYSSPFSPTNQQTLLQKPPF